MPESKTRTATNSIAVAPRQTGATAQLRSTNTIRRRAQALLARARRGESTWFKVNDGAMLTAAALVAELTRARYPDLVIPYHSRWRHFEAGGVDRLTQLNSALGSAGPAERARAQMDLALVSVLLDAGAGADWCYHEAAAGEHSVQEFTRSEGLGVASFHAFMAGLFSSDLARPLQADAAGLQAVTAERLADAFQVSPDNPLIGLDGRAALLRRLGQALQANPALFGQPGRPGHLFDRLAPTGSGTVQAHDVLSLLLTGLAPIWAAQNALDGEPLGDCWRHPAAGEESDGPSRGWMPFHKLSQWLTYSLLEPFEWAGVKVEGLNALTGLPEYRNGGLFLDAGVLMLKNPALADSLHAPGDELIVEWRALTVALLDELAPLVREQLGLSDQQMPLACVLEGGTWAAGRALAQQLHGGQPPLNIQSDGTVF
ncbi:MAG: URC4/urg3 family protein [Pseudomonadota bacterium]